MTLYFKKQEKNEYELNNTYYVDDQKIVRRASQYHSETIGYILTERIDR